MPDPKFNPGDPLSKWTAADYRDVVKRIESVRSIHGAYPVVVDGGSGGQPKRVRIDHTQGFYAQLSGSTSPYSFTEKAGASSGAWSTHVRTGTTSAYEVNGVAGLNGKVVWVEPGFPGDWRFQYVSSTGGGPPTGTLLGCVCRNPPATLTMTVDGACTDGRFYDTTITYKATPSGLGALQLGANCYLSDDSFPDPQTGDYFYYFLSCFSSVVRISRVFETSIYGSPFLDSVIYFWTLGFTGNTCSPFYLSNGTVFAGGDPDCQVILSG